MRQKLYDNPGTLTSLICPFTWLKLLVRTARKTERTTEMPNCKGGESRELCSHKTQKKHKSKTQETGNKPQQQKLQNTTNTTKTITQAQFDGPGNKQGVQGTQGASGVKCSNRTYNLALQGV